MQTHFRPQPGRHLRSLLLTAAALGTTTLFAQASDDEVRLLREQLVTIQARLEALEQVPPPAGTPPPSDLPIVTAGAGGFSLASADKRYQLRIRGNVQADARLFFGDTAARDDFLLRRVRPSLEGTVADKFSFRVMPDFAGSSFVLMDAYVAYHHSPAFNLIVGKAKSPFDLERLVSQTDLLFIERAYPTSLGPNRDVGLQVRGEVLGERLSYQVAIGNGVRDNDSGVSDNNNDKDVVVRLFAHPFRASGGLLKGFGIGVAASHGERSGAPSGYRTQTQQPFFSWRQDVVEVGDTVRMSPQFHYYRGPMGFIGSWVASRHDVGRGSDREKLTHKAWFFAAHWVLTGEEASSRGVQPRQDFDPSRGTWGAWELAVRFSRLDIDETTFPLFADPDTSAARVTSSTIGVNGYLNRNLKLVLNFEHSEFAGGASGSETRADENALFSRVQLSF